MAVLVSHKLGNAQRQVLKFWLVYWLNFLCVSNITLKETDMIYDLSWDPFY